jgi:hypothetical protein
MDRRSIGFLVELEKFCFSKRSATSQVCQRAG